MFNRILSNSGKRENIPDHSRRLQSILKYLEYSRALHIILQSPRHSRKLISIPEY